MSAERTLSEKARSAYLLALATWMDTQDMRQLHEELAVASRRGDEETRQGYVAAIEYLSDGSLQMDVQRVNRHVDLVLRRQLILAVGGSTPLHPSANQVPLIRVALRFDAPWMKAPQELNMELGMAEILRAFSPLPRVHDGGFPSLDELQHIQRKKEERTKYTTLVSNEIMRALRRMVESGDPVKGVFPDNI